MKVSRKEVEGKVSCDSFTCKSDGTVVFRKSYFYRHGATAEAFAATVQKAMGDQWVTVYADDMWAAWPKTSYFVATMRKK